MVRLMGQPAEMSDADKRFTDALATAIVDNVVDDGPDPIPTVRKEAAQIDAYPETLVLWLAQRVIALGLARDEACDVAEAAAHNHDQPRNHWDKKIAKLRKA